MRGLHRPSRVGPALGIRPIKVPPELAGEIMGMYTSPKTRGQKIVWWIVFALIAAFIVYVFVKS